jgi:hypothetical protein
MSTIILELLKKYYIVRFDQYLTEENNEIGGVLADSFLCERASIKEVIFVIQIYPFGAPKGSVTIGAQQFARSPKANIFP